MGHMNVSGKQLVELNKLAKQKEEILTKKDSLEGSIFKDPSKSKDVENCNRLLDSIDGEMNKINEQRDKDVKSSGFQFLS